MGAILQFINEKLLMMNIANLFCFGIGGYLIAFSMTKDIKKQRLNSMRENIRAKRSQLDLLTQLNNFIRYITDLKQWVLCNPFLFGITFPPRKIYCVPFCRLINDFMDIYQPIMMLIFAFSLLSLCGCMLIIQMELVKYFFRKVFANFVNILLFLFKFSRHRKEIRLWCWCQFSMVSTCLLLCSLYANYVKECPMNSMTLT